MRTYTLFSCRTTQKPCNLPKVTYLTSKEHYYILPKETYCISKEPCNLPKETYRTSKEHCILPKEPYILSYSIETALHSYSTKRALHSIVSPQKSPHSIAWYIKRALCSIKRALYSIKRDLHSIVLP